MSANKNWFAINRASGTVSIFSDIGNGGVTARDFRAELAKLGNVKTLHIDISSNGGDVTEGFAIFDMLARHPARKVVRIQGLAASMASVIAMVGDEIEMPSNAMLMIHEPWGSASGSPEQIASFGQALDMMKTNIVNAYVKRTHMSEDSIRWLMRQETWMNAEQAVEAGFADRIVDPVKMAASYDLRKFQNVPQGFGKGGEPVNPEGGKIVSIAEMREKLNAMNARAFRRWNNPPEPERD